MEKHDKFSWGLVVVIIILGIMVIVLLRAEKSCHERCNNFIEETFYTVYPDEDLKFPFQNDTKMDFDKSKPGS